MSPLDTALSFFGVLFVILLVIVFLVYFQLSRFLDSVPRMIWLTVNEATQFGANEMLVQLLVEQLFEEGKAKIQARSNLSDDELAVQGFGSEHGLRNFEYALKKFSVLTLFSSHPDLFVFQIRDGGSRNRRKLSFLKAMIHTPPKALGA